LASPSVIALAGPNGAGKTTAGPPLLSRTLGVKLFVNADLIAAGLSVFEPDLAALTAGKVMLERLKDLAASRSTFAFETTLAGRLYARWLQDLIREGYRFHLVFFYVPSPEFAIERVKDRVRGGGHAVPEETVRRRFHVGLRNFFALYQPLSTTWRLYDNSASPAPSLVAAGRGRRVMQVRNRAIWSLLEETYGGENEQRRGT
jgi:predicted ABC-type ATPase